ncbi:MAG TPA: hypothetical protein VKF17_16815 [Isosphaeraceae bacterium]|nr:hypothetical protein [Isosphaeraceae bacterium]
MANNFSAFFETLVAGADEYNKAKVGQTALLNAVYKDVKPEAARIGKTVDVYFPDFGPLQSIGNGILTGQSVNPNYVPLVFNTRAGAALQFQDFEQWQTAVDLAQKFFDPLYKRAREYLNGQIAALITTTNFNANAPIIGATQGEVTVADQLNAWGALADQKVPLEDSDKLSLLVHNRVYQKMLADSGWVQESLVSASIAAAARENADLAHAFNFRPKWDQQMPTSSGTILYGQVVCTSGSATVTGLNTNFTTAGPSGVSLAGYYLTFGADSNKKQFQVTSVQSDTSLTLTGIVPASSWAATTGTTTTARLIVTVAGTVTTTAGSTTLSLGTASALTSANIGQWLAFSTAESGNTVYAAGTNLYQIASVTNTTTIVLATPVVAADVVTSGTATIQSFTNLAMHEYAIALALRPIATPDEARNVVDVSYLDLMGIPLRVMVSYVHIYQALFVTVDFGYALGVIRPDFGVIISS